MLPLPAPVTGLILLYVELAVRGKLPDDLGVLADRLLQFLGMLFVPDGHQQSEIAMTWRATKRLAAVTIMLAFWGRCVVPVVRWISLIGFVAPMGLWLMPLPAMGRDLDGRYANSPLKPWLDQLKSRNGPCCSNADGYVVEDADWEAKNGHYRVRVPEYPDAKVMVWIDVPDNSVITAPNKAGRTMVWPVYFVPDTEDESYPYIWIRCFMPGSMT